MNLIENSATASSTAGTIIRLLANVTSNATTTFSNGTNNTIYNNTTSNNSIGTTVNSTNSNSTIYTDMDDIEGDDGGSSTWMLIVAVIALFVLCACAAAIAGRITRSQPQDRTTAAANRTVDTSYAGVIAKMTAEERIVLYNDAFDTNKNQIILTSNHIIVDGHHASSLENGGNDNDGDDVNDDNDNDSEHSIYLALENARIRRRSSILSKQRSTVTLNNGDTANGDTDVTTTTTMGNCKKNPSKRSSIVHPRDSVVGGGGDTIATEGGVVNVIAAENNNKSNSSNINRRSSITMAGQKIPGENVIRGECVICFEDMEIGEHIVWSESQSCRHVYHKECMVAFLAHKRRSQKEVKLDDNPCPTCRQKFVSVIPPPDFVDENENENE